MTRSTVRGRLVGGVSVIGVGLLMAASSAAVVDLAWSPATVSVEVGDTVQLELWAYADEDLDFNSAQAILTWDAALQTLTGNIDPPYPPPPATSIWSSSFPFGDSFGLNEASPLPLDGDGLWVGEVAIGQTLPVTPAGLLLTTLTFEAVAPTAGTEVAILPQLQLPGHPLARSKFNVGTQNVLGTIGPPAVVVITEPLDYPTFYSCFNGPAVTTPPPGCSPAEFDQADLDSDSDVDLEDFSVFQLLFAGR